MTGAIVDPGPTSSRALDDLAEVVSAIWPPPVSWTLGALRPNGQRLVADLVVMPGSEDPRVLVPRRRALAAAATRAATPVHTTRLRARGLVRTSALRLGAAPFLGPRLRLWMPSPSDARTIEDVLGETLGVPVTVSVRLGPPRANRKPVLHALTAGGAVAGVAKLGLTNLTRALVRTEGDALDRLGRSSLRTISTPRLLHAGQWGASELVVQTPLVAARRERVPAKARIEAMREVAAVAGTHARRLEASPFVSGLRTRIDAVARVDHRERLQAGLARVVGDHEPLDLVPMGSWHGDWTDWNVVHGDGVVMAWDWERFATEVPLGFDALHYAAQPLLAAAGVPTAANAMALLSEAPRLLAPFSVDGSVAAATARLYLLEIGTRYAADSQLEASVAAGAIDRWLLPVIESPGSLDLARRSLGGRP